MGSSGYLLLQQSDFLSNYVGSFQELRNAGELFDVTLACEDETIEAHKVVISACSPFFRHVFSKTKQNHPFVYLKGVLHKDLVALLDYVYTGETQVPAEDVNRFIEAAQELKIKGLAEEVEEISVKNDPLNNVEMTIECDSDDEKQDDETGDELSLLDGSSEAEVERSVQSERIVQLQQEIAEKTEKIKDESGSSMWKCKDCGKICKKKDKIETHIEIHLEGYTHSCTICNREYRTRNSLRSHIIQVHKEKKEKREIKEELNNDDDTNVLNDSTPETKNIEFEAEKEDEKLRTEIFNKMEKIEDAEEGSMWKCTECGKMLKKKSKLELHVETHLDGFTHICVHCGKIHKTRIALKKHIVIYHKGTK